MNVLVAVERLSPTGGAEISTLQLTKELARRGHQIDLVYETGGVFETEYRSFCRSVNRARVTIRKKTLARDLAAAAPTLLRSVSHRPDVVYVQLFGEVPFGALASRLLRTPLLCHLRGFNHYSRTASWGRHVSRFIAVSMDTKEKWRQAGIPPERIDVVYNGIDPEVYRFGGEVERLAARETLGLPPDAFVALYLGRLDSEKGVDVLLKAWRELGLPPDRGRLVVMGETVAESDPEKYLETLNDLAPQGCEWLSMRRDVLAPLHAADVVAVPSFAEGLSRTLLEAMATGRPVVASRVGGMPEVLTGEFEKLMFEPGDPAALARLMSGIVDWRDEDPNLGRRCRAHIEKHFSLNSYVDGVEAVLETLPQGAARSR